MSDERDFTEAQTTEAAGDDRGSPVHDRIAAALTSTLRDLLSRKLAAGLYLVGTPIGNLGDITPRALATIVGAHEVFCEDTRISGPMLARFGINRRLLQYHEHNAGSVRGEILAIVEKGGSVALISDAGSPAISDPGFKLARAVIAAGGDVFVVPGPTALAAAVTVSGLPTDSFFFGGFLPQKSSARRARISELGALPATLVLYESPHRVADALRDLADVLGDRQGAVARELTKKFEEVRRGTLGELAAWSAETPPRGEIAIVVAPPAAADPADVADDTILEAAREALAEMRPAAAAKAIAQRLGVPRARVYDLILSLKQK